MLNLGVFMMLADEKTALKRARANFCRLADTIPITIVCVLTILIIRTIRIIRTIPINQNLIIFPLFSLKNLIGLIYAVGFNFHGKPTT